MLLTVLAGLLVVPLISAVAITPAQLSATVMLICPDSYGNRWFGTGTVVDPKGIILTNKHVITDEKGAIIPVCHVGFVSGSGQEPNFYSPSGLNIAEVKYYPDSVGLDVAILYLANVGNRTFSYADAWSGSASNLQLGEKIEIVGFPIIGGRTITYSSGDFSGFGGRKNGVADYLKTSAPIEHGNSGGAAYNAQGDFLGIPSKVVVGPLNSLSYILSIDSIRNWLSGLLGPDYLTKIRQQPVIVNQVPPPLPSDTTPPDISRVQIRFYDCSRNYAGRNVLGELQPTHWPILKKECTEIAYDPERAYPYSSETVWTDVVLPDSVSADIAEWNYYWAQEPNNKPIAERRLSGKDVPLGGFWRPSPNGGEEGEHYWSLQLVDAVGNVSDVKIWRYHYQKPPAPAAIPVDSALVSRLKGRILLQVESFGEAWYVNPEDGKRYYMGELSGSGDLLRRLGLGISNRDLGKIPIGTME